MREDDCSHICGCIEDHLVALRDVLALVNVVTDSLDEQDAGKSPSNAVRVLWRARELLKDEINALVPDALLEEAEQLKRRVAEARERK
jgi:hypothetical protein